MFDSMAICSLTSLLLSDELASLMAGWELGDEEGLASGLGSADLNFGVGWSAELVGRVRVALQSVRV